MKPTIGFIGLGIMGRHMASHLLNAGYQLVAYDVVATALDEVVAKGAGRGHPAESGSALRLVISWYPTRRT
jgi:3-hydroxyisobutyrate dehydrogenase-like beta-hydroxyacid dehydrogenase